MNKEQVEQLVLTAPVWERHGKIYRCWDSRLGQTYALTRGQLCEVDCRLPGLIERLSADCHGEGPYDIGQSVQNTLRYWKYPHTFTEFPCLEGGQRLVETINEIHGLPGEGHLVFNAMCLALARLTVQSETGEKEYIPYIEETYRDDFCVSTLWLDEIYPGWFERLLAVQALGMPVEEQAQHVLVKLTTTAKVKLDGVGFD